MEIQKPFEIKLKWIIFIFIFIIFFFTFNSVTIFFSAAYVIQCSPFIIFIVIIRHSDSSGGEDGESTTLCRFKSRFTSTLSPSFLFAFIFFPPPSLSQFLLLYHSSIHQLN
ncbi:hypothetical protein V6Z11_A07G044700 [Gossypium hirsutum]